MSNKNKSRIIQNLLKKTNGIRVVNDSIAEVKITNDHAFYKLICEKAAHFDYSVKQFNLLYFNIYEEMMKRSFTILEINNHCEINNIPVFNMDELLTLIPKETRKNYIDYQRNTIRNDQHEYLSNKVNIVASYIEIEAESIANCSHQDYIVDSDIYYKFIYKKLCNSEYTYTEYNTLYEGISEELVHTNLDIDEIIKRYDEYGITPPTEDELKGLVKKQEDTRSGNHFKKKIILDFQGRINIKIDGTSDDPTVVTGTNELNFNIDLFHNRSSENSQDKNREGILNNKELLKALENTVKTFNDIFGIKKDNNPFKVYGNIANFRLFLFEDSAIYQDYLNLTYDDTISGFDLTEISDNNYISNMYLYYGNVQRDANGEWDYWRYNYIIKHEFIHALTFCLTARLDIGKVLMKGLAEYTTLLTEGDNIADFTNLVEDEYKNYSLEKIIKGKIDPYKTGITVIAYLEQNYPDFMDNLLYAATEDGKTLDGHLYFKQMMQDIYDSEADKIQHGGGFSHWVQTSSQVKGNVTVSSSDNRVPVPQPLLITQKVDPQPGSEDLLSNEYFSGMLVEQSDSSTPTYYNTRLPRADVSRLMNSMHHFPDKEPQGSYASF
ncbi:hypothetical protein SK355_05805 [Candidatus Fukatsuia symbiotica]|uniref:Uncharacterized protein n=2 Tax=Candidatus Fukatsuia TaxID=1927833 RepID=A0A2U8I5Z4_9GAMM|nr:hypothetical protein [Candidatus Fukatsuia symbiotica]AWK14507.1 hypothetical protein CCS41_08520 [Candidatus Fukatsuia symbiotica]MEA9444800.1 hypothetical protein [Candidatus Fukatsuia symbiotica]